MILHGDLPPVGNPITLAVANENSLEVFLPAHKYWLDSGTSALALALLDVKQQFPQMVRPRAIIPGYCCPDLVAACVYAGIEPVAVDIEENDPAYNLDQLRAVIDERVVAVIAINFLGIAERLIQLRELISSLGSSARLIEDNAQWFPTSSEPMARIADYVTFSFGRGKPLSLLGGGLLVASEPLANDVVQHINRAGSSPLLFKLKVFAYNLLLRPPLYALLNRNPFMRLGETKYIPLEKIEQLDSLRYSLLQTNFYQFSQRDCTMQQLYTHAIRDNLQLLSVVGSKRCGRLLRYPLLCIDKSTRDSLLTRMCASGLGATSMYKLPIDQIEGVGDLIAVPAPLTNASSFANRFMTLPIYPGIAPVFREKILALLKAG